MCIGDWRLGRLIKTIITPFDTTAGLNCIILPSRQRVGLTIMGGSGVELALTFSEGGGPLPAAVAGLGNLDENFPIGLLIDGVDGAYLTAFSGYFHITMATHGELPTKRFVLNTEIQPARGLHIQYTMPEEYLAAALESFKQEYKPWIK